MSAGRRVPTALGAIETIAVTVCGLGLLRPAPGSWGSLPPVAITLLIMWSGAPWWVIEVSLVLLVIFGVIACVKYGRIAEEAFGAKDPSSVVADETAGCAVALLIVPWWMIGTESHSSLMRGAIVCAVGLFFFRLFDVWKPGSVADLQNKPYGWGIVLDDIAAGAWAWPPVILATAVAMHLYK